MKYTDESLFEESQRNIKQEPILQENQTRRLIKKIEYEKYIEFRKILVIRIKRR